MTYIEWLSRQNKDSVLKDLAHDIGSDYSFPQTDTFEVMHQYFKDSFVPSDIVRLFLWSYGVYLEEFRKEVVQLEEKLIREIEEAGEEYL